METETMNHSMVEYCTSAIVGLGLGIAYFGTLWLAVRHVVRTKSVAIVAGTSLLRLVALFGAIWVVTQAEWQLVMVCLACLLAGRQIVFAVTSASRQEIRS